MSASSDYLQVLTRLTEANGAAQAEAARQNGQIWGNTLAGIGKMVSDYPAQQAQMKEIANRAALTQLERDRETRAAATEQRNQQSQQQMQQLIASTPRNPDGTYDTASLMQKIMANGGDAKAAEQIGTSLDNVNGSTLKYQQHQQDQAAEWADNALKDVKPDDPDAWSALHFHAEAAPAGFISDADKKQLADLEAQGVSPVKMLQEMKARGSQFKKKPEQPYTLAEGAKRFGANNELLSENPKPASAAGFTLAPGATRYDAQGNPIVSSPAPTATLTPYQQEELKRRDQEFNLAQKRYELALKNANKPAATKEAGNLVDAVMAHPELFGQLTPTAKANIANELDKRGFAGFAKPPSATMENRLASAKAVVQTGDDIIVSLKNPSVANQLGPVMGRYKNLREFIGNPPPELADLAGNISSFALAQMGVHGMRNAQMAQQIEQMLDAKHTPASLVSTITGINRFANHLLENEGRSVPGATTTTPPPSTGPGPELSGLSEVEGRQIVPQRTLSESEFNTIKQGVLDSLPSNLSEDDFNRIAPTKLAQAIGEAESKPPQPEGSAIGRFASGAAEMLNPVTMVKGAVNAVRHPIDTATALVGQQVDQAKQAYQQAQQPGIWNQVAAAGHLAAAALPVLGPVAARIGEQAAGGDVAGAAGKTAGLLAPFAASETMAARATNPERAALLEREASQQVAGRVLAPGNPAFRGRPQAIAPEILARKLSGNRLQLQEAASEGMADAVTRIDECVQAAGGPKAPVPAAEVISELNKSITDLQLTGIPYSQQAAKRIQLLKEQILDLKGRAGKSGVISYEDLKGVRDENYRVADEARAYEKMGDRSLSDQGYAAREAGSAVQQTFARRSPETAAANADYSFFKTLNDILDPAIGRPKATAPSQGVTGGARTVGAVTGAMFGGKAGAFIGSTVLPWLKERMTDSSWQLADAQRKMQLAQALKAGDVGRMRTLMLQISKYAKPTNPDESQAQTAPATP